VTRSVASARRRADTPGRGRSAREDTSSTTAIEEATVESSKCSLDSARLAALLGALAVGCNGMPRTDAGQPDALAEGGTDAPAAAGTTCATATVLRFVPVP
jgi:hypothetical protein